MMEETSNSTSAFDKTTLMSIGGEYPSYWNGTTATVIWNVTNNYSVNPYPLSVGKTWTVTVTDNFTNTGENRTTTHTYDTIFEVEDIESVTVPAGTFQCFKIVKSYDNGSTIRWVTDETRGFPVKITTIDFTSMSGTSTDTTELISYSLSE